jgi:hypothetical protein
LSDAELQTLRRKVVQGDAISDREALTFVRAGFGWHGETLPSTLVIDPDRERGLYLYANNAASGLDCMEFVYVPKNEVPCPRCDGGRKAYVYAADLSHVGCVECHATPGKLVLGGFYIGRFPVTTEEWSRSVATARERLLTSFSHPVTSVSFASVLEFCTTAGFRLPTEQEWWYVALGPPVKCDRCNVNGRIYAVDHRPDGSTNVTGKSCPSCGGLRYLSRRYPWGLAGAPTHSLFPSGDFLRYECAIWADSPVYGMTSTAPAKVLDPECSGTGCDNRDGHWRFFPARPESKSWCGAYDMIGNVWELSSDSEAHGGSFRSTADQLIGSRRRPHQFPRGYAQVEAHFPDGSVRSVPPEHFLHEAADDLGFRVVLDGVV